MAQSALTLILIHIYCLSLLAGSLDCIQCLHTHTHTHTHTFDYLILSQKEDNRE